MSIGYYDILVLPRKNVVTLVSIAVPSTSSRCFRQSPSCYVCWFVLKERVYQVQVVNDLYINLKVDILLTGARVSQF